MKGLTLNYLDRKPEAYELVRAGLKHDLRSHVCWHVYGLLYRSDREYREAIKCYANALRLDKGNQQILRDMAWLQVQMRDRSGLVETRRQLLTQKPGVKANWLGFSVAAHLDERHRLGVHILEAYEKTLTGEPPASEAYEHSEMILYKLQLLEEGGEAGDALALLQREDSRVVDRVGAREARVRLLNRLDRAAEALPDLEKLIDINPENTEYYAGLLDAHALPRRAADRSAAQEAALDALYARLAVAYPRCSAVQRTLLDWKEGEAFLRAADSYARRFIQSGIPSLFTDLKPLYADDAKRTALEGLMLGYLEALQADGRLPPPPPAAAAAQGPTAVRRDRPRPPPSCGCRRIWRTTLRTLVSRSARWGTWTRPSVTRPRHSTSTLTRPTSWRAWGRRVRPRTWPTTPAEWTSRTATSTARP